MSGGANVVLHSFNMVLSKRHDDESFSMLTMDFSNFFNIVDISTLLCEVILRFPSISLWVELLYDQEIRLYVGDTHIWSTTGV